MKKELKKIKEEEFNKIVDQIKKKTNAEMVIIMYGESKVPCKEEKEGRKCIIGHKSDILFSGVEEDYLSGVLESAMEIIDGNIPSNLI